MVRADFFFHAFCILMYLWFLYVLCMCEHATWFFCFSCLCFAASIVGFQLDFNVMSACVCHLSRRFHNSRSPAAHIFLSRPWTVAESHTSTHTNYHGNRRHEQHSTASTEWTRGKCEEFESSIDWFALLCFCFIRVVFALYFSFPILFYVVSVWFHLIWLFYLFIFFFLNLLHYSLIFFCLLRRKWLSSITLHSDSNATHHCIASVLFTIHTSISRFYTDTIIVFFTTHSPLVICLESASALRAFPFAIECTATTTTSTTTTTNPANNWSARSNE